MATEADLIQKFKDLNIPVGADFEELIHEAFAGANLVAEVENNLATKADDSKVVHSTDMRTPASNVAGINEVNAKQDKIGYTPADDSKVAHLSGANNFNTVPTVNNNPLLLASSLPSDLARTGSDQEFTGKNTFDTAPIDKTTGNPYITKDGVPAVPSTIADTTKDTNFTGKLQKSGIDVATTMDVTNAVSTATANMVDSSKPTNFTAGLQSGGLDVATAADLKSVEASAWRELDNQYLNSGGVSFLPGTYVFYRLDTLNKRLIFMFTINLMVSGHTVKADFRSLVRNISIPSLSSFSNYSNEYGQITVSGNLLNIPCNDNFVSSLYSEYSENGVKKYNFCFVNYEKLV